MNTNAFRSPTDKEWTRFRGSNVSGPFFPPSPLRNYELETFLGAEICVKFEGFWDALQGSQIGEIQLTTAAATTSYQTFERSRL